MTTFNSKYKYDSQQSVGLSFIRAYNIWHRQIKTALAALEITHPQFVILASLGYLRQTQEEITQIQLAQHSDIDVMTVSTILKNLEKKHLIKRETATSDPRAKKVSLTNSAESILNLALDAVETI